MYSTFYRHTFIVAALLILGWLLWSILEPLWTTIAWAAVLAFLLHPLHERLTKKFKNRASLSAGLLTALAPFCIMAPVAFLGVVDRKSVV